MFYLIHFRHGYARPQFDRKYCNTGHFGIEIVTTVAEAKHFAHKSEALRVAADLSEMCGEPFRVLAHG